MLLADKLFTLRKEKNISLEKLHLQTGISIASLSAYEKGKYMPSVENLCILAKFYAVPLDELLGET